MRLDRDGRRSLDLLRWGLAPWWSKDIKMGARCINAMAETVATKPAFRDAFARGQRCIVPVDGSPRPALQAGSPETSAVEALLVLAWINLGGRHGPATYRIGGPKKTTGTVKEQAGKIIGDRHLETEGKVEKTEGRIRSGVGKAMDAVRDVVNDEK